MTISESEIDFQFSGHVSRDWPVLTAKPQSLGDKFAHSTLAFVIAFNSLVFYTGMHQKCRFALVSHAD